MCKMIEEMRKREREEDMRIATLRDGTLTLERIAKYVELPLDELKKLQAGQIE